jgi:NAD(P)-dependent dehydrogenase (short-subunit alcohol dehydrogenase family)
VADSLGESAIAVDADVSLEEGVECYTSEALERFGCIDLYHLNAAISGSFAPFAEVTTEDWDRTIAVDLTSVFLRLRAALRQYEAQGSGGAIVTTSSMAGLQGSDALVPYTAAKHAVIGLTRCAALAGAPLGVRVNCVAPGMIMTPLWDDFTRAIGSDLGCRTLRLFHGAQRGGKRRDPSSFRLTVVAQVRSCGLAVRIVVVPPLVGRSLRIALGRVLPLLLTAERRDVEVTPGCPHRLVAPIVDEVGAEYPLAVTEEGIGAVPLVHAEVGVEAIGKRVPGDVPAHALLQALEASRTTSSICCLS